MANKLSELICSLKAFTVILVEDDFTYEDDPGKILGKFCCSGSADIGNILNGVSKLGLEDLKVKLHETFQQFHEIQHDETLFKEMPASDYIDRYLVKIGQEKILENGVLEELKTAVEKDDENLFKNILLRHGIYGAKHDAHYQEIINELESIAGVQILYYNSRPSETEMVELRETLLTKKEKNESQFFLAIVDNRLGTGNADEDGKLFIKNELLELNKADGLKIICCIYTSRDLEQKPVENYKDYFIQEIKKGSDNVSESIAECLAQTAYVEVFNSIKENTIESAGSVFDMVLKNQKNIKHIVGESHKEGIPSYEAIKHWYSMALYSQFEQKELQNFLFYGNLTSFFNNTYLN